MPRDEEPFQRADGEIQDHPVRRHQDDRAKHQVDLEIVLQVEGVSTEALIAAQVLTDDGADRGRQSRTGRHR